MELALLSRCYRQNWHDEIKEGKVEVSLDSRGMVVSLKQAAFFPSGTDSLTRHMPPSKKWR